MSELQPIDAAVHVMNRHGIARARLSARRDREALDCRNAVIWLLRQAGWSLTQIGDYVDRDHSTIHHALDGYQPPLWLQELAQDLADDRPDSKRCANCETAKPLNQFDKHSSTPDGRQSWCRLCIRVYKTCPQLPGPLALAVHQIAEARGVSFEELVVGVLRREVDRIRTSRDIHATAREVAS